MNKYDENACCTVRGPRDIFRAHTDNVCSTSLVGPLVLLSFSLLTIEFALAKIKGSRACWPRPQEAHERADVDYSWKRADPDAE